MSNLDDFLEAFLMFLRRNEFVYDDLWSSKEIIDQYWAEFQ